MVAASQALDSRLSTSDNGEAVKTVRSKNHVYSYRNPHSFDTSLNRRQLMPAFCRPRSKIYVSKGPRGGLRSIPPKSTLLHIKSAVINLLGYRPVSAECLRSRNVKLSLRIYSSKKSIRPWGSNPLGPFLFNIKHLLMKEASHQKRDYGEISYSRVSWRKKSSYRKKVKRFYSKKIRRINKQLTKDG